MNIRTFTSSTAPRTPAKETLPALFRPNFGALLLTSVALSLFCGISFVGTAQAEGGKTEEPSADDLKNSKERGLFIEQPSYVKAPRKEAASTEKPPAVNKSQPPKAGIKVGSTKPALPAVRTTSVVAKAKPKTTVKQPMVAKTKPAPSSAGHIQVVKTTPTSNIKTVAYDGEAIISAWLNKPGETPTYKDGEKLEINVKASRDCNLTIYDYDGRGKLTQIFPNTYQQASLVKGGETVTIGGSDSQFEYQLSVNPGERKVNERIFVFAYPVSEAPLSIAMNRPSDSPFRSAEMTPEEYRKLVNQSKVFFSREVKVMPKAHGSVISVANVTESTTAPNKIELSLMVEK